MNILNKILIEWNNPELNNSDNIINVTGKDLDRIDNFPEEYIYQYAKANNYLGTVFPITDDNKIDLEDLSVKKYMNNLYDQLNYIFETKSNFKKFLRDIKEDHHPIFYQAVRNVIEKWGLWYKKPLKGAKPGFECMGVDKFITWYADIFRAPNLSIVYTPWLIILLKHPEYYEN